MVGAGAAARVVQGAALPFQGGDRSARRARGIRAGPACLDADPGVGLHRRAALSRRADAAGRDGGLERAKAGGARDTRRDDRHRPAAAAGAGMNGAQDLGGQMGFGPVAPERNEPVFHADWEKRALGVTLAAGAMGHWTIDESRHARESLHPADYYASSYYEIWIKALEVLLQRHGLVAAEELSEAGRLVKGTTPGRVLEAADVPRALARACSRPVPEA